MQQYSYWKTIWRQYYKHPLGRLGLFVVLLFCIVAVYAPFLASSKPLFVSFDGTPYFPLFRYLFYKGFFTKSLDIFFNLMIFTLPAFLLTFLISNQLWRKIAAYIVLSAQILLFLYFIFLPIKDPAADQQLTDARQKAIKEQKKTGEPILPDWNFDLQFLSPYARLNLVLQYQQRKEQNQRYLPYAAKYEEVTNQSTLPTLWQVEKDNEEKEIQRLQTILNEEKGSPMDLQMAQTELTYILARRKWLDEQSQKIQYKISPLLSPFHWEDDAGGQQALNQFVPWYELTRINRKDLLSALIFGVRISLVVGIASIAIALAIGVPIGAMAGFYGGTLDILVSRLLEIWEAMPTFFMLLMAVAILQSKSIFIVIAIIGLFGWTSFSRYIRGEFFKHRNLTYVEACKALGFSNGYTMFKHILPNAIPPVLTLLPFAIMGAISSEAGLSFLGLGEEGSCSWGVLMDEGRTAFPQESYLLWPPAILLTTLLIAIALVGDTLRDALDPKLQY